MQQLELARRDQSNLWRVFRFIASLIRPLLCKLRVVGIANVPATGGCVIACNHTVGPDYLFLGMGCPRQVHYMAKSELFAQNAVLARILLASGVFPVKRGEKDVAAVDQAVAIVRGGRVLGMFPEGTRSKNGALMRGKTGVVRIATRGRVPIVPAVVVNADKVFARRPLWQRPTVTVRFGKPLLWEDAHDDGNHIRHLTTEVMTSIASLLPEELRGYYGEMETLEAVMK